MTIEDRIFERKRFILDRMMKYGFAKRPSGATWESDFMNGDFRAVVTVSEQGAVSGKVIDNMNDEEYMPLRVESRSGSFVGSVREAYEEILTGIAESCCEEVLFASNQANKVTAYILEKYDVSPDFPWGQKQYQSYGAFRHTGNRKWFALIMSIKWDALLKNKSKETVDVINLKIDPADSETLIEEKGIYPGYHMNRKHWISVMLNDTLTDDRIASLVENSYTLTK